MDCQKNSCEKYGAVGSEEYNKLVNSLNTAEENKKELENKIRDLRKSLQDLEKDLDESEKEVLRLRSIQRRMYDCKNLSEIPVKCQQLDAKPDSNIGSESLNRELFIHRLDFGTTVEDLKRFFGKFGEVLNARIIKDPVTQCSKGYGFVLFSHEHMAKTAMDFKPHWILSRMVETSYAKLQDPAKESSKKFFRKQKKLHRVFPY